MCALDVVSPYYRIVYFNKPDAKSTSLVIRILELAACSGDCRGSESRVGDRVEENGGCRGGAGLP